MKKYIPHLITALAFALSASPTLAQSKAVRYLINEQIESACTGGGRFDTAGVIERDLTGDGKPDLILDHGAITCNDGNRSTECGFRACSVYFYVREGNLLKQKLEILSIGVTISGGTQPSIALTGHNFEESSVRWDGGNFR